MSCVVAFPNCEISGNRQNRGQFCILRVYDLYVVQVAEVPCVIEAGVESFSKTKQAVTLMKAIGAYDDVEKAKESRKVS